MGCAGWLVRILHHSWAAAAPCNGTTWGDGPVGWAFYPTCFPRASGFVESIKAQRTTPSGLIIEPAGLLQSLLSAVWQSCAYYLCMSSVHVDLFFCGTTAESTENSSDSMGDAKTLGFLFLLAKRMRIKLQKIKQGNYHKSIKLNLLHILLLNLKIKRL